MAGVLALCCLAGFGIFLSIRPYLPLEWTIGSSIRYGKAYRASMCGTRKREA